MDDSRINDVLVSPVRRRIVSELAAAEPDETIPTVFPGRRTMTARQLAELTGLHVSTVRFHLGQLVVAGILESATERRGVGRPRLVYAITESFDGTLHTDHTRPLTLLSELLVAAVADRCGTPPQELGREWVRHNVLPAGSGPATDPPDQQDAVAAVDAVMHNWGFDTELTTSDGEVTLALLSCPFRELANISTDVVCGVHEGVIKGTLAMRGAADDQVALQPFAHGTTCLARFPYAATSDMSDPHQGAAV